MNTYKECNQNSNIETIRYYEGVEDKVKAVEDLLTLAETTKTESNFLKAERAVSDLYGVANGLILEDLEYRLATLRTKTLSSDEEYNCQIKGGNFKNGVCNYPTLNSSVTLVSSGNMVSYNYNGTEYLVINSKISVSSYVDYIQKKICPTQSSSFRYGDQCLRFAEEHAHALYTGENYKSASDINKSYYSDFKSYDDTNKTNILNIIYGELTSNRPVILQVNGARNVMSQ